MTNRWVPLTCLCAFAFFGNAIGQNSAAPAATNQPAAPLNVVPVGPEVTPPAPPIVLDQSLDTNSVPELTNEVGAPLVTQPQQAQIGAVTPGSGAQPASQIMGTSALATPAPPLGPVPPGPGIPLWGPISIHPLLNYTFLYGKGIQAAPGESATTAINTFSPGFILTLGGHWTLEYSPSFSFYSSHYFKNTVDENVYLRGAASNEVWSVSLMQSYIASTDPLVETGQQTSENAYATTLSATHQFSGRSSINLTLNQNFREADAFEGLTDLREWNTQDWFNYQMFPFLTTSLGATAGYDNMSSGSDMPYEEISGRVNLTLGQKLLFTVTVGGEDRQFLGPDAAPLISPVFMGSLRYAPFLPTLISLDASRSVTPSLFQNQLETVTTVSAAIRQQLTPKLAFILSGAYSTIPLTSIVPEAFATPQYFIGTAPPVTYLQEVRSDVNESVRFEFNYRYSNNLGGSVFYTLGKNTSGTADFNYTISQVGFTMSYQF